MSIWLFFKSRVFIKNFIGIVVVTIFLTWFSLKLIDIYTRHNKTYIVPDVRGLTIDEISQIKQKGDLKFIIIDSIYDLKKPKGSVIAQDPAPGTKVKYGRKIYLTTITILPEMVNMPNLEDLTLRQALAILEIYGLKVGRLEYVPDIAENAILAQKYKGQNIQPNTPIEKGSKIDLVVGKGLNSSERDNITPNLIGKFRSEAIKLINEASMNVGSEIFMDGKDTVNARVFKQMPLPGQTKIYGQPVDLWYKSDKKFDFNTWLKNQDNNEF
ncbi:MAG TPA: PASTA domain-containing protein [Bacteroidales bacterium]|nr:PASTA domain-containing protein [Bacteroidales bacterium]